MPYAMENSNSEPSGNQNPDYGSQKADIGQPTFHRIARAGARPLRFSGSELAMAMSFTPEIPYWYEINLYRTTDSQFVAAVRLFYQSEERRDTVEAWTFSSLDEALAAIEHYDAANDVEYSAAMPGDDMPGAEIAGHALALQAKVHAQRQHYRGLVGEILYELDAG